jgi:hypothetical protein
MNINELVAEASALASEKEYKRFIESQPSCISGRYSEFVNGEPKNIACHIRRVKFGSGTAKKNSWFYTVPMTSEEHQKQHNSGESSLRTKDWFEEKLVYYLTKFIAGKHAKRATRQ